MKLSTVIFFLSFLSAMGQSDLDQMVKKAAEEMNCPTPSEQTPVTLRTKLVTSGDSLAVIVKTSIAPGWHIYAYVGPGQPYIVSEPLMVLPEGIESVGDWQKNEPSPTAHDPGVLIYEDEVVFVHKAVKRQAGNGIIKAGLYFQTCDLRQCLPPKEVTFQLKYE